MGSCWRCALGMVLVTGQLQAQVVEPLNDLLARVAYLPPEQAWHELQQAGSVYINDADYNYALGVYASDSRNYAQAINALERTVLLNPVHAGAWLDLAIAYKQAGDAQTALELLNHIKSLNPSSYLQLLLQGFQRDWSPIKQQLTLNYTLGYSTNPTAASVDAAIPFYLGGWTTLALSETMRPQASEFQQFGVNWMRVSPFHWWLLQSNQRYYQQNESADQQQIAGLWQYTTNSGARWQGTSAYSHTRLVGYQAQAGLMYSLPISTNWYAGAGYRGRRFQQSEFNNNALTAQLQYQPVDGVWQWVLEGERELPTGQRPGGGAQRWQTQFHFEQAFTNIDKLSLSAQASFQQDCQEYASIIPLKRQLTWYQLSAYWYHALDNQLTLKTGVQWGQQEANHGLFDWQDTQWSMSILWRPF